MANSQRTPSARLRLVGLLALSLVLIAGVTWLLASDRPAERSDTPVATHEPADPRDRGLERERRPERELAREAKASVSGTVRSVGGSPIANAQVCARPELGQLRGLAEVQTQCVRSGPDGHYRIDGLWPVRTGVGASAAEYQPATWRGRDDRGRWLDHTTLSPGGEAKAIDLELLPGGVRLSGVIKDIGGGEIEGARVELQSVSRVISTYAVLAVAISDGDGKFELWAAPGEASVRASAEGYANGGARMLAPSQRVEIFLMPESVLVGQVVHAETGEPMADMIVNAGGNWTGREELTRSDEAGNFRIGGLHAGVFKPSATSDEFYGQAAAQVHLGLAQASEPVVLRVHPIARVEGSVVLAGSQAPCSTGSVQLVRTDKAAFAQAQIEDQGRVTLRGVERGEYLVEVRCDGQLAREDYPRLVVGGEPLLDQVWAVDEGQAIRGVVVDGSGQRVANVKILARMLVDPNNTRGQTTNGSIGNESDGSFAITGLLPGRYELSVRAGALAPEPPPIVELAVGVDRNDVRIELPSSGTIVGRVVDEHGTPQPGIGVEARLLGRRGEGFASQTDDEGKFAIERVRPGEVRVFAGDWQDSRRKPGTTDDDVQGELATVVANARVEVELRVEARAGTIRGRVLDEQGSPIDDAFISADRMSDSATASSSIQRLSIRWAGSSPILSEIDGSFTIEGLAEGSYLVHAHRRGGGEAIVEGVALGSDVVLTIAPTGVLAGKVVNSDGEPPERFEVRAQDSEQGLSFSDRFLRTAGAWQLRELPAGKYTLTVSSGQGTSELEVELAEGARHEDLELILQPRVTLRGRVIDIDTREPVPGMTVHASPLEGWPVDTNAKLGERKEVSDEAGNFEVEGPTGKVRIVVSSRTGSRTSPYTGNSFVRTIPMDPSSQDLGDLELIASRLEPDQAAGDIGFNLQQGEPGTAYEAIRLTVGLIHPGGPASTTTLAVGDVIETVDGKSVLGIDSGRFRSLCKVAPGTTLSLGLADSKSVDIVVGSPRE